MKNHHSPQLKTPLGDLLAAASEVAFEYSNNDKEAHDLAQLALVEIVRKTLQPSDIERDFEKLPSSSETIH